MYLTFDRLLDKHCDSVASKAKLHDAHQELYGAEIAVGKAFASESMDAVQEAFHKVMAANEAHLKHEESVMMPMVQKLVQEGHPMKKYMKEELLAAVTDLEFFITYASRVLERHVTAEMPRFRVFTHALWAVATPEEWSVWSEWIRSSVADSTYQDLERVL